VIFLCIREIVVAVTIGSNSIQDNSHCGKCTLCVSVKEFLFHVNTELPSHSFKCIRACVLAG
jgi:hypothetical protein